MNFKSWLLITEMAGSFAPKYLEKNSLQALSETELDPVLKARYKRLVSEWDYGKDAFGFKNKKNDGEQLTPADVTPGSNKMISWKCLENKTHTWPAPLNNRTTGRNCPTCANKRIGDDNSLQALSETELDPVLKARYKRLVSEWDTKKNILTAKDVTIGSKKMINWKCKEEHTWAATLNNRTNGNNCPDCAIAKASLNHQIKNDQNLKKLGIHFNDKENLDKEEPLPNDPLSDFLYLKRKAYQDFKNKTNYTTSKWYNKDKKVGEEAGLPKGWYLPVDKKGISKPAKLVGKILNKYFDDVAPEYIDRECNAITGRCFRFDYSFIYKDQEYFVEYHGEQHYYPRYFGSGENKTKQEIAKLALDAFKVNQKNDRKKYNYCESEGFPLLVIPYWTNANKFKDIILDFIKHDHEFDTFFAKPEVPDNKEKYHDKMYAEYLADSKPTELVEPKTTASVTQEPTKTFEQFIINKNFINI